MRSSSTSYEWVVEAVHLLGIDRATILSVKTAPDRTEAEARLKSLKRKARSRYRKFAAKLHPDVTGNDTGKAEALMALGAINDHIQIARVGSIDLPRPSVLERMLIREILVRKGLV